MNILFTLEIERRRPLILLGFKLRKKFESSRARMLNSLKFLKNQGFRAIFVYADFMNPF